MNNTISRRFFLKKTAAGIGALAAASLPGKVEASKNNQDEHLATVIDIQKCIGCEACVDACHKVNDSNYPNPKKPFPKMYPERTKPEDWSDKKQVRDRLTPYNWIFIQSVTVNYNNQEKTLTIPRRCMHCINPPCVKLCPWGAAKQFENGISKIDSSICLGGSKCKSVCPWKIPQRQTGVGLYLDIMPSFGGNGVMYKCDRCYDRIAKGETPACIEECPEGVQTIGKRGDMINLAEKIAKETNGYIYGINENGGTNTFYVSPVPFDMLDKAIKEENGKPHLKVVSDMMGQANNLAYAMFISPIAGIAAAVGTYYNLIKKQKNEGTSNETK
ncbi:MAG: 4Fe-4S dicluster domain-containing protein [Desulfobacterales bacterium]|nr:4Fe-4S dicluster domain-containing protein [Desulfobacterales bacterium]MBF0398984.1 4Fe-4S dicluster domain-containing protein [Desulfobacterales bacterium]